MKKKRKIALIKDIVCFILYIIIFIYLIYYFFNNQEIVQGVLSTPLDRIFLNICCAACSVLVVAGMDIYCARVFNLRLKWGEVIGITFVASALNLFLPLQMGSAIKAYYYKKKFHLPYSKYISIASGTAILQIFLTIVQLLICIIGMFFCWKVGGEYIWMVVGVLFVGIICFIFLLKCKTYVERIVPFKKYVLPIIEGFYQLAENQKAICGCSSMLLIGIVLGSIRFWNILNSFDSNIMFINASLYFGIYTASSIVPVLPGNIGIAEGMVGLMMVIFGHDFDLGMSAVLINRIYIYIVTLIGALAAGFPIYRSLKKIEQNSIWEEE